MKWIDYREKLGIGFSDQVKAKRLANMVVTFVCHGTANQNYEPDDYYRFCLMTGIPYTSYYNDATKGLEKLFLGKDLSINHIISYYIAFVNSQTEKPKSQRKLLLSIFSNFLDELNIPYEIIHDKDGSFVFPKGAKELDDALVSEPLEWLKKYPKAHKEWIEALKKYADFSADNPSEVADKFRKALERFFQEFFKSEKSLEHMKSEYGDFLTSKGVPAEIKNNLEKILDLYAKYINNYAKHHDKAGQNVLEYILYQTGNLIRLLITLKQEDK